MLIECADDHGRDRSGELAARAETALEFLDGRGIEVGALAAPLDLPEGAQVTYVDRMRTPQLTTACPALRGRRLAEVEIVDDVQTLGGIEDDSQDFAIAGGVLQLCRDPLSALESLVRVVRVGGIVFLTVPDRVPATDESALLPNLERALAAHEDAGPEGEDEDEEPFEWCQTDWLELVLYCRDHLRRSFEIALFKPSETELITVLRKRAPAPPPCKS